MIDFRDMMSDVLHGFKVIGYMLGSVVIGLGFLWGILSAMLVLTGKITFTWWMLPCWIEVLIIIAGAIGNASK